MRSVWECLCGNTAIFFVVLEMGVSGVSDEAASKLHSCYCELVEGEIGALVHARHTGTSTLPQWSELTTFIYQGNQSLGVHFQDDTGHVVQERGNTCAVVQSRGGTANFEKVHPHLRVFVIVSGN